MQKNEPSGAPEIAAIALKLVVDQAKLRKMDFQDIKKMYEDVICWLPTVLSDKAMLEIKYLTNAEDLRKPFPVGLGFEYSPLKYEKIEKFNKYDTSMMPEKTKQAMFADGDKITCLVCREKLSMITRPHLRRHGLTAEEYKKEFGIPQGMKLCSIAKQTASPRVQQQGVAKISKDSTSTTILPDGGVEKKLSSEVYKSLFENPNSIVCLICGERKRVLSKTHLAKHGLTPEQYKQKWGIPPEVRLTAANLLTLRLSNMNQPRSIPKPCEPDKTELEGILPRESYESLFGTPDNIVCLVCRERLKFIMRPHLAGHGLTLEEYKKKYGIPVNVKLVCESMRKTRSTQKKGKMKK